ncbi:hypothetical protein OJ611_09395, partial [Streptococcus anginosus]
ELFFYNKIGSIISIGDLPTTNIIEPELKAFFVIYKVLLRKKVLESGQLMKKQGSYSDFTTICVSK